MKKDEKRPAIESIYSSEEKKGLSKGLIIGLAVTFVIILVLVLAAISMKSDSASKLANANENYNISFLGTVNAKTVSLPIISIVLGFIDGFNPCAMWILVFLILMLIELKDKKKMWILGSVFLITSGLIYLVFMVSWLNLAMFLTGIKFVRYAIGLFALVFGVVNVYRFFNLLHKDDGCDVTDGKKRSKIMTSIRKIVGEKSFIIALGGIILLAAGVNLLELLCSLGIPVVFTQILALNDLNVVQYLIYILLYLVFFMIDDFIVFFVAMFTLKITGVSNKYTKFSHLIGGILMAILGILMMFKPAWVMFNFENRKTPIYDVTYGEFVEDAKSSKLTDISFDDDKINVYLFYGDTCPHCRKLENLLVELREKHGTKFNYYGFETWKDKENQDLMLALADRVASRSEVTGVPFLIVGNRYKVGYADYEAQDVTDLILGEYDRRDKVTDKMKDYINELDKKANTTTKTTTIAKVNKKK